MKRWRFASGIERTWLRRLAMIACIVPQIIVGIVYVEAIYVVRMILWPFAQAFISFSTMRECWDRPRDPGVESRSEP